MTLYVYAKYLERLLFRKYGSRANYCAVNVVQ
jgi:hypothetical protein